MARRGDVGIADCGKCKQTNNKQARQALGCGYEPRDERVHLTLWQPPGGPVGFQEDDSDICAGYTTSLPEVMETLIARIHWSKGNGSLIVEPTEDLLNAIVILEGEYNAVQNWIMTPSKDGGGGA